MAQVLETVIAINAKCGNGFSEVGSTLAQLGSMVDGISSKLQRFGEDSLKIYRDYEKSMKDAEVALSTTYGQNTKELQSVMSNLDEAATQWAATTIFHTNDVGNAISEASHAGWNYEQILNGIPAAMRLAEAGGLDLSEAVNYIVKSTNAAGIGFEDLTEFVDLWAFAANSSASTVGEFGEAMLRLGSTMRFASNTEELMTLIAVTANAGSVGSEAGTMIRNSILRLVAPTNKADEVMAGLGATSEEVAELLNDQALAAANAELAAHGFSAYDENGNMKSVLETYRGLYMALGDVAGGFDNISKNEKSLKILSTIFPTRTITEALALLNGAAEDYGGLYDDMMNGAAEGYGEYAAATMMDTLNGRIETFGSKVERLKQLVGEELSGQASSFMESIGGIVDSIAELDEGKFEALVAGLEVVAVSGPGLMTAGSALRFIGYLFTPTGAIGMGAIALTSIVSAVERLQRADFEDAFGTADIDKDSIMSYVNGLGAEFEKAYSKVDAFRAAVDKSVESYQTASETFSSQLLTKMITGATLTGTDKETLKNLGTDMQKAVLEGLQHSTEASMSYWELLFGGEGVAGRDEQYRNIIGITDSAYTEAVAEAENIGKGLRDAMTAAFSDGTINEEEYADILSYVQSYNEAIARAAQEAQDRQNAVEIEKLMHKAQTASLDEIEDVTKQIQEERDRVLEEENDNYETSRAKLSIDYDEAIARGEATEQDKANALTAADNAHNQRVAEQEQKYDAPQIALWDSQMRQSDLADAYTNLEGLAKSMLAGEITPDSAYGIFKGIYGGSNILAGERGWFWEDKTRQNISEALAKEIEGLGGYEGVSARIDTYTKNGDTENAEQMKNLLAMSMIGTDFAKTGIAEYGGMLGSVMEFFTGSNRKVYSEASGGYEIVHNREDNKAMINSYVQEAVQDNTIDMAKNIISAIGEKAMQPFADAMKKDVNAEGFASELMEGYVELPEEARRQFGRIASGISWEYDVGKVIQDTAGNALSGLTQEFQNAFAAWSLMYGPASANASNYQYTNMLPDQVTETQLTADTQQIEATIDGIEGRILMMNLDGDAANLEMKISDQNGKTLVENVTGDASSLAAIINSYSGRTITVNIQGQKLFAAGGRATSASIFGEAGPEWAIPEEHSQRTADLLNAAREASGFTWADLLTRYGGMNANPSNTPTTIVYSPTIHAADASGVEQVLSADKERLDKWYREKKIKEEAEEFA